MSEPEATMSRIGEAIGLNQRGDPATAERLLAQVWSDIGGDEGDPLHRCAVAHSMADVQDDVHEESKWDLRALEAAHLITNKRATAAGVANPVSGFYPSLHLNLGECYGKLGDYGQANEHLQRGRNSLAVLGDDGYGQIIREALDRLGERLEQA